MCNIFRKYLLIIPIVVLLSMFFPLSCSQFVKAPAEYSSSYLKGMNVFFTNSRNQFRPTEFATTLDRMKSDGINTIFIITYHFAQNETSSTIFSGVETVSDSTLSTIVSMVQSRGIEPVLKPHIDLLNGQPRYLIKPGDMTKWINDYKTMLLSCVKISNQYGLHRLVVGTEIDNVAENEQFRGLINEIKEQFSGEIIYAASFDHGISCSLWDVVDAIGVDAYYNLCKSDICTSTQLVESWNYWLGVLTKISILKGKPVYLTEIGYYSREGCSVNPGDWSKGGSVNYNEQAKAYESLLCQAADFEHIKGIFWWQWELNNSWNNDSADYTPFNKPAEQVIRKYWTNE